jgi:hypothetical protein
MKVQGAQTTCIEQILFDIQVEKKQLLIQQETDKLREREEVFMKEQQALKTELAHRKKVKLFDRRCKLYQPTIYHDVEKYE